MTISYFLPFSSFTLRLKTNKIEKRKNRLKTNKIEKGKIRLTK